MAVTDSKCRYKAKGNIITCNQHDGNLVVKSEKQAKVVSKMMNRAIISYYKAKSKCRH